MGKAEAGRVSEMETATQIAQYLLSKDREARVFAPVDDEHVVAMDGSTRHEGNVRLNKCLHIAQNLHIAMYGEKLFADDLYACTIGGVVPVVQDNYALLRKGVQLDSPLADGDVERFLDRFSDIYDHAPLDELVEISREDPEWVEKSALAHGQQKMDSLNHIEDYKEQYEDAVYVFTHENFGVG
jgi:uncharacterized phage-associated protein